VPVQEVSGELLAESPIAVAEVMMNRALAALEACPGSLPITETKVVIGELVWDECCGILAGLPIRTFRSATFPLQDTGNLNNSLLAVDIGIVLLRCVPVMDDLGNVPTVAEETAVFTSASMDAAVILDAMLNEPPPGWETANVEQTFIGVEGGCIAIDTRLTVGLPQTDWCVDCGAP
jgi:hypothetical protein